MGELGCFPQRSNQFQIRQIWLELSLANHRNKSPSKPKWAVQPAVQAILVSVSTHFFEQVLGKNSENNHVTVELNISMLDTLIEATQFWIPTCIGKLWTCQLTPTRQVKYLQWAPPLTPTSWTPFSLLCSVKKLMTCQAIQILTLTILAPKRYFQSQSRILFLSLGLRKSATDAQAEGKITPSVGRCRVCQDDSISTCHAILYWFSSRVGASSL